jgi:opacity protein-like surface antigen
MKKYLALLLVFAVTVVVATSASAQAKFKDVPDDHWAASAVYDLVRLGVTKGYPDGTFRGKNRITRYETAILISKLAKAVSAADIKADIRALRDEIATLRRAPGAGMPLSGSYAASFRTGNLLTEKGGVRGTIASYRLKLSTTQDLGEGANVIINLDTMDYGYFQDANSTGGNLATELLDIESNLKLDLADLGLENPVDLKVTFGPGPKQHAIATTDPAGGVIPSDVGITYIRPDTGAIASTSIWGMDVSGGYLSLRHPTSGRIQTSQVTGTLGHTFEDALLVNSLRVEVTGDYLSKGQFSSDDRDIRGKISLAAPLAEKVNATGTFGMGGSEKKSWMVAGELELNDLWDTGTVANIRVSKIGSEFITGGQFAAAEFDFAGYDNFSRPLENGTVNIGGELVQTVSDDVKLIGKGDLRLEPDYKYEAPKGRLTAEGGISYAVAPNTTLDASYRIHHDKSISDTSDVAAVGLMYEF